MRGMLEVTSMEDLFDEEELTEILYVPCRAYLKFQKIMNQFPGYELKKCIYIPDDVAYMVDRLGVKHTIVLDYGEDND